MSVGGRGISSTRADSNGGGGWRMRSASRMDRFFPEEDHPSTSENPSDSLETRILKKINWSRQQEMKVN